jgi:hypothetical protein
MIEPELLALQEELQYHPELMKILIEQPTKDIYIAVQEIALYCKVLLHGDYNRLEVLKICEKLTEHLYKKRTISVFSIEQNLLVAPSLDSVGLKH